MHFTQSTFLFPNHITLFYKALWPYTVLSNRPSFPSSLPRKLLLTLWNLALTLLSLKSLSQSFPAAPHILIHLHASSTGALTTFCCNWCVFLTLAKPCEGQSLVSDLLPVPSINQLLSKCTPANEWQGAGMQCSPLQRTPYASTAQATPRPQDWKKSLENGKAYDHHVLEIENWETNWSWVLKGNKWTNHSLTGIRSINTLQWTSVVLGFPASFLLLSVAKTHYIQLPPGVASAFPFSLGNISPSKYRNNPYPRGPVCSVKMSPTIVAGWAMSELLNQGVLIQFPLLKLWNLNCHSDWSCWTWVTFTTAPSVRD